MDCSPPGSSVHGVFQARILEWIAIFLLQAIFPEIKPVSLEFPALAGRFFTTRATCMAKQNLWNRFLDVSMSLPGGWGFPHGSDGKASARNEGDPGSIPGLGRFPCRRKWQPTPVFLPGESHG